MPPAFCCPPVISHTSLPTHYPCSNKAVPFIAPQSISFYRSCKSFPPLKALSTHCLCSHVHYLQALSHRRLIPSIPLCHLKISGAPPPHAFAGTLSYFPQQAELAPLQLNGLRIAIAVAKCDGKTGPRIKSMLHMNLVYAP